MQKATFRADPFPSEQPKTVTFEEFLASAYDPANKDVFTKAGGRIDPEDLRGDFCLMLYTIDFPSDLTPERANNLLRRLASMFVRCRHSDHARRADYRESNKVKTRVAETFSRPAARPLDAAITNLEESGKLDRLAAAVRDRSEDVTAALQIAVRSANDKGVLPADRQHEMPPRRFREAIREAAFVGTCRGIL